MMVGEGVKKGWGPGEEGGERIWVPRSRLGNPENEGTTRKGGSDPKGWERPERVVRERKISRFCSSLAPCSSFFLSEGLLVDSWPRVAATTTKIARLGFSGVIWCEPRWSRG